MTAQHIVIMAAGTGGHVIPGLAIAHELRSRGHTVSWLGTPSGMENRLVPEAQIALDKTSFDGLRGKGKLGTLLGGFQLVRAFFQSLRIIKKRKASAVIGMGGYVCFPGGMAASTLGTPLVLINADASLLLSNKLLQPIADATAFGLDGPDAHQHPTSLVTGNPVREAIAQIAAPAQRFMDRSGPLRLLVVGGSSGAKFLNDTVPQALALMPVAERPRVTHQSGVAHLEAVRSNYDAAGVQANIQAFVTDMAQALADCDVVLCRAGAIMVSELCAAGVASVLVPLVVSTTSHQQTNAQWLAAHGAAMHLPQRDLSAQQLAHALHGLERSNLQHMAEKARSLAKLDASKTIVDLTLHLVGQRKLKQQQAT